MEPLNARVNRRTALQTAALALTAGTIGATNSAWAQVSGRELLGEITPSTLWSNLDGKTRTWFHPRGCMIPQAGKTPLALMTLQEISGSDYFGPVHSTTSSDEGRTWSEPEPIAAMARFPVDGHPGLERGICDVVPEYHAPSRSVLALGHIVFYRGPKFSTNDQLSRYPLYAVRSENGEWSDLKKLEWDDPRGSHIYSNNCGQRVVLPDGDVLLAFTFGSKATARSVAGVRCAFDGQQLTVKQVGPALEHNAGRGLLEPSITRYQDRIYLTIRAEDNRGYVAVSDDGLKFSEKKAWTWDDGEPLTMSTTQQHWLTHSDGLFLVYTRKDATNAKVTRWRSPLFVAQVDPEKLVLIRATERVVQPLVGDGIKAPDDVPLMGNFHCTNVSPTESWVTVGSWLPKRQARGATHLARIQWTRPNRLVKTTSLS